MKKVLIVHTGGTFGMSVGLDMQQNKQPDDVLADLCNQIPELKRIANIDLTILCNIDSSSADPTVWSLIASKLKDVWADYDGFLLIHGTDTMAYAATALSFFIKGANKPVVFTGSQRPLSELRNDARHNIIDALEFATLGYQGVFICFDHYVHLGVRATKYSNNLMEAFRSPNFGPVGEFGVGFQLLKALSLGLADASLLEWDLRFDSRVLCLTCLPGQRLDEALAEALLTSYKGIILSGFGTGNLPLQYPDWIFLARLAHEKKVPVAMASQCGTGKIDLMAYENGRAYLDYGVMSIRDMTLEAAAIKMMVVLGRNVPYEELATVYETSFVGELT